MCLQETFTLEVPVIVIHGLVTLLQGSDDVLVHINKMHILIIGGSHYKRLISNADVLDRPDHIIMLLVICEDLDNLVLLDEGLYFLFYS